MTNEPNNNIENRSVTIGVKMLWTVVGSMVLGSLSLAGMYFGILSKMDKMDSRAELQKAGQTTIDAVQNLTLETIKLDVSRINIELKDIKKAQELKQDKNR